MTVALTQTVSNDTQSKKTQTKQLHTSDRSVGSESVSPVLESSKWTLKVRSAIQCQCRAYAE